MNYGNYETNKKYGISLLGERCAICGSTDRLEFDHIDPRSKLFAVSNKLKGRLTRELIDEILKCQLLCYAHHRQKHATAHGKRSMYNKGCRCDLCRLAARDDMRKRRASLAQK